jgi:16S rRNA A1518/A1519 N6-dimethyltransferase RsmA/KsgA/DIM1 with predicted DNA glycosylase/AP lyase activity
VRDRQEADTADYRALVRALFSERRRMVKNSVVGAALHFDVYPEDAGRAAVEVGVGNRRPEELSVAQFEALSARLRSGND